MTLKGPRLRGWTIVAAMTAMALTMVPADGAIGARPRVAPETRLATPRIAQGLLASARADGSVRVIVNLRQRLVPSALLEASTRTDYRRSLAAVSTRVARLARATGGTVARRYDYLPAIVLYASPATLAALRASANVASVAPDLAMKATLDQSVPIVQRDTMAAAGWNGTNQIVAVLDTGVQADHPFLAGKLVDEACFAAGGGSSLPPGPTGSCPNGLQTQTGPGAAIPCTPAGCLHGTHVAGIATGKLLATSSPSAGPIAGVARSASLLPIQVFSVFTGTTFCGGSDPAITCALSWTSDQAAGLEYVYAHPTYGTRRVASANLSIGGEIYGSNCDADPSYTVVKDAAGLLTSLKIATIYAAGNGAYVDGISGPACLSAVVSVGSADKLDVVSSFSNYADFMSLLAPAPASTPRSPAAPSSTSTAPRWRRRMWRGPGPRSSRGSRTRQWRWCSPRSRRPVS